MRSRPQQKDSAEETAVFLCSFWAEFAGNAASHIATSVDKLWCCSLKNLIVRCALIDIYTILQKITSMLINILNI